MKLNSYLQFAIDFTRFVAQTGLSPYDAAQVTAAARRCFAAGERWCNDPEGEAACVNARAELRKLLPDRLQASFAGGLWPSLEDVHGRLIHIPSWD